jgi:putative SOS response-associated peptidase YedK
MCGRFTHLFTWTELRALMGLLESVEPPPGWDGRRYNVAPTQDALVIRQREGGEREPVMMRWGLVPWWADDLSFGNRAINARSESASSKPAFREAMQRRRCLVPATGFYEWEVVEGAAKKGTKQPWYVLPEGGGCAFAGLWERWKPKDAPEGEAPIRTFTILTTRANPALSRVHERMPVVIPRDRYALWLDPGVTETEAVAGLLESRAWPAMEMHAVGTRVNRPANDDPGCVEAVEVGREPGEGEAGLFG